MPSSFRGGHRRLRSGAVASSKSLRVTGTSRPLPPRKLGLLMLACSHSDRQCLALSTALSSLCMSSALAQLQAHSVCCRQCGETRCHSNDWTCASNRLCKEGNRRDEDEDGLCCRNWPEACVLTSHLPGLAAAPTAGRLYPSHPRQAWHRLLWLSPPSNLFQHVSWSMALLPVRSETRHLSPTPVCIFSAQPAPCKLPAISISQRD